MHSSALNGARNKRVAQVQHDTEIQLPRSTPSRHSMEKNSAPQGKVRSTARKILLRHRFRHKVLPVYTQGDCPCSLSFHGAAFDVIPLGVFQGKITSRGPCNADQAAMSCSIVDMVARYRFLDERANVAVSLIWNIQPEGLFFTACWLPLFNGQISRSNSWESPSPRRSHVHGLQNHSLDHYLRNTRQRSRPYRGSKSNTIGRDGSLLDVCHCSR